MVIEGNMVNGNHPYTTPDAGIEIAGYAGTNAHHIVIAGNSIWLSNYGVKLNYVEHINIQGNAFQGQGISQLLTENLGEGIMIRDNVGYITENCGTASGTSPITIPQTTHLLDVDPTYVNAVSKTSGYYVISVSYDPTTRDITIEHSGGATSIDVFWEAKAFYI